MLAQNSDQEDRSALPHSTVSLRVSARKLAAVKNSQIQRAGLGEPSYIERRREHASP